MPSGRGPGPARAASVAVVVLTLVAGAWLFLGAPSARADLTFTATSAAVGVQVELNSTSVPLSTDTAAGGPTAQTDIDSDGTSDAYAASPDPSQSGATLPPLVCTLSGLSLPSAACTYPLFASTARGQSPQKVGVPGNEVSADSENESASASVTSGQSPGPQMDTTSMSGQATDGSVSTTAAVSEKQVSIGGKVVLDGVHVSASAQLSPAGQVTLQQDFTVTRMDVAGQSFSFANGSFSLPGAPGVAVPSSTVLALLKQAGVTGHIVEPTQRPGSIVTEGLNFSYTIPATPDTAASTVSVTVGLASAQITDSAIPGAGSTGLPPASTGGSAPGSVTAPASVANATVPVAAASSAAGTVGNGAPATSGSSTGGSGSGGQIATPAGSATSASGPLLATSRRPWTYRMAGLYLLIVGASALIFLLATGLRILGVKTIWRW
jgi:hypothetical protein